MDGGAWKAAVHGVAKSRTRLSDLTFTFHFHALEKKMAPHSSVLAWRIPGTGEPGGCRLWGHTESDTSEVTAAAAAKQQRMLFTTCSENCHHLAFSYHFLLAITGHSVYLMDWCFFIPLVS